MSATINENLNPFRVNDRVVVNFPDSFLDGETGIVKTVMDISVEVNLDSGILLVIFFQKLAKEQKKKKKSTKRKK